MKLVKLQIESTVGAPREMSAVLASSFFARAKGWLGKAKTLEGDALWISPCASVHTWGMRISIDLVFVAPDGSVLKVVSKVGPWRFQRQGGAAAVLELPAGAAQELRIQVGDRLRIV